MKDFSQWSCLERGKAKYTLSGKDSRRWYQRDIDQITHSTGFRKLQRKSQLLSEKDPRSRSRLIHTIEVSRIAMEISERLGLSKELTEAISLGHDIGTSPYGCIGNRFLQEKAGDSFSHELVGSLMLIRIAQKQTTDDDEIANIESLIEECKDYMTKNSDGIDFSLKISRSSSDDNDDNFYIHHITPEVLDGICNHGSEGEPHTLEGQVVKFADNIAYLSQDIEDLLSTKIIKQKSFVGKSASKAISYNKNNSKLEMTWDAINNIPGIVSLNDAFNATRGKRISTFVNRYVQYNLKKLEEGDLDYYHSEILNKDIPRLKCDDGLLFIIDYLWNFIEGYYDNNLIKTSNEIQKSKMNQLWQILNDDKFKSKNQYYKRFLETISQNTMFSKKEDAWKIAYFISNLSWQEVDFIIDSYHKRNYNFDLDLD